MLHETALEVHWLSIINSFVLVLLLTVFLAFILMRVLKNDFARYLDVEDDDLGAHVIFSHSHDNVYFTFSHYQHLDSRFCYN